MKRTLQEIRPTQRINVLGVRAHAINTQAAKATVLSAIKQHIKGYVCFVPVNGVMEAQLDPRLMRIFENALLVAPDGMPLVWVGHAQGFPTMERVAGPEFMLEIMGSEEFRGCSHFLCGGEPGTAQELRDKLLQRFPGLDICGIFTPPFRPMLVDEEREFIEAVHRAAPDFLWVGLGAPKQEHFMARYLPLLDTTIMLGVGAAFLMHSGRISNSPKWVRQAGLQWFHRLLQEPRRLWRRYILRNPVFIAKILYQFLRHGRSTSFGAYESVVPATAELKSAPRVM
jgi:N-acetylglucosaminyldiphosphoundecaprenol N-acetyl-beta-D-mannosaminyltransferase